MKNLDDLTDAEVLLRYMMGSGGGTFLEWAARLLSVKPETAQGWILEGKIPAALREMLLRSIRGD